jgi:NitT/TauT family transport system permease protein
MSASGLTRFAYPLIGAILIIGAWDLYVVVFDISVVVVPRPGVVLDAIIENPLLLLEEGWATLLACVLGFALAVVIGIPLAVLMTDSRAMNLMFYPLLIATQSVPKVAIAPILLIWFGTGLESKLAIAFFIAFFPMIVDTATGLRATPAELLELARSLRSSYWQIFFKIRFPAALPHIFSGAKVAVTLAVIGTVIGEFVGGSDGLGSLLLVANSQINSPLAWAALVGLSILGIILYMAVVAAEWVLMPWARATANH